MSKPLSPTIKREPLGAYAIAGAPPCGSKRIG
jgi:hypothetical protein